MSVRHKILFVLPSFGRSGAVDFIVDLASEMAERDCEAELLVLTRSGRLNRELPKHVTLTFAIGEVEGASHRAGLLKTPRRLLGLARAVRRSDLVMLTWEMGRALLWPSVLAWLMRKPTIAIVQNNVEKALADYRQHRWHGIVRWAYARALAVVCVSHDLVDEVAKVGIERDKLVAIPNAVNVDRIRSMASDRPPEAFDEDSSPTVVGVGRLSNQKGFDLLIRAHASVRRRGIRHRLMLIGHGPDKAALQALAQALDVADSVVFTGFLENPYPAIANAAACCLSSRYEGRSLVLSESALLGVPIIATDCPTGPREVLADGRYGELVEAESVPALSRALARHLKYPERLTAKAQLASLDASRYSIQTCASRYVSLIDAHLGGRRAA